MSKQDSIVIVGAARTPMGAFLGAFKDTPAPQLGAAAIAAALKRSMLDKSQIQEVYMGCVLSAGQGQAPARQAAMAADLPLAVSCTTINKMCGSGMKAIMIARDTLIAENFNVIIAGGMENMSNAPYLLPKARAGYRMGHHATIDHMFLDGLEDAYDRGRLMGAFAEDCAKKYQLTRAMQDEFAAISLKRAQQASAEGTFASEIAPVLVKTRQGDIEIEQDETFQNLKPEKIPQLKPAFDPQGTVTAANSSSISDGAAALVLMRESDAIQQDIQPLARILGQATQSQEPHWFTTAPVGAIQKLLDQLKWTPETVDLYEINEAFAVVPMVAMQTFNIPIEKININGGACALGHPIGASGARILVTLLYALQKYRLKRGIAALCIGGGEATAMAIEICEHIKTYE